MSGVCQNIDWPACYMPVLPFKMWVFFFGSHSTFFYSPHSAHPNTIVIYCNSVSPTTNDVYYNSVSPTTNDVYCKSVSPTTNDVYYYKQWNRLELWFGDTCSRPHNYDLVSIWSGLKQLISKRSFPFWARYVHFAFAGEYIYLSVCGLSIMAMFSNRIIKSWL